jgi:hypothetical protein
LQNLFSAVEEQAFRSNTSYAGRRETEGGEGQEISEQDIIILLPHTR